MSPCQAPPVGGMSHSRLSHGESSHTSRVPGPGPETPDPHNAPSGEEDRGKQCDIVLQRIKQFGENLIRGHFREGLLRKGLEFPAKI